MRRRPWALLAISVIGFVFLYGPIASLVLYSFNDSRLVTVWGGFTTRWYGELFGDDQLMSAAWLSLRLGFWSAGIATLLGTMAGYALSRWRRFRGRRPLGAMVTAPLVMPEVVMGLAMLLLFVSMERTLGWPAGRGLVTMVIAHATFTTAFVAVVIQSRLAEFDMSLEEAAQDLGAPPLQVFILVTLPLIAPAVLAGWLLAFTLSFDDVVIAQFTSGPGASSLPMVVFSKVRLGVSPDVNALATLMIATVALGVIGASLLSARRRRRGGAARSGPEGTPAA